MEEYKDNKSEMSSENIQNINIENTQTEGPITKKKFFCKRNIIIGAVVVAVIAVVVFLYVRNGNGEEEVEGEKVHKVAVETVVLRDSISTELNLAGEIVPIQDTIVTSLVNGTVVYIPPVGSEIVKGETLFVFEDDGISSQYTNTQIAHATAHQNLEQTKLITHESVVQSRLALSSAEASLRLAERNVDITRRQADTTFTTSQSFALVAYTTAYNLVHQVLISLNHTLESQDEYVYSGISTTQSQLRVDTTNQNNTTLLLFKDLDPMPEPGNYDASLKGLYSVLVEAKQLVDMTSVLLQNAIAGGGMSESTLELNQSLVASYQGQINQSVSSIINARSGLSQASITRESQIDRSENQLEIARIQHDNALAALSSAQRSAEIQVLGAENGLNAAQGQLDQARVRFNNLTLTAPFSGTLIKRFVEDGDQVSPGKPVLELGRITAVKISVDVSSDESAQMELGQEVIIDDDYVGTITSIQPAADSISGKVMVEIKADNSDGYFVAGDTARVAINLTYDLDQAIFVPLSIVRVDQNTSSLWVVNDDNIVERRGVELGQVLGYQVEIVSGLEEGERYIRENGQFLQNGEKVEIED